MAKKKEIKKENNIKNNFLLIYICFNIVFLLIERSIFGGTITHFHIIGKSIVVLSVITFIISIINFIKNKKKIGIYEILILLIILFGIISTIFAINQDVSLFGREGRYEGLFAIVYYILLTYLTSYIDKDQKIYVVYAIVGTGIFESILGICQILDLSFIPKLYNNGKIVAVGTMSNPNFYGSYMLLTLSYVIGLFMDSKKLGNSIFYAILILIAVPGLLLSNTTGCIVGLLIVLAYLLVYSLKNKSIIKFLTMLLIILLELNVFTSLNMTSLVKDLNQTRSEVVELSKGHYDAHYGTNRVEIWRQSLKIVPKYAIHGAGIDNFAFAFGKRPLAVSKYYVDKAHNEYLQILIAEGAFALIAYLVLYAIAIFKGIKNSFKEKEVYLLLPVIGYLVAAFFNISVIEVAPIFYISLGLLINKRID